MKKILIVMLVIVMALLAAGCSEHEHELTKVEGKKATCTATGVADYWVCSGCNKLFKDQTATAEYIKDNSLPQQLITDMKPHDFKDDKDCTTDDKCKNCDTYKEAEYENHVAKADDGDCTTAVTCKNCSVVLVEKKDAHVGGVANCTTKASCEVCGKAYGSVDPDAHDFSDSHGCFSNDFNTCTIAGECARCEEKVYEVVETAYANGKAIAVFSIPSFPAQTIDLTNPHQFTAPVYYAALTYMVENGESDIEVMFPVLKNCDGPVYDAVRETAKWYLEGCQIPEEVPNTVNAIQELIAKLPF